MHSIVIVLLSCFLLLTQQAVIKSSTNEMVLRDTAQYYYETLVDDVMNLHNEDLLSELAIMTRHPHQLTYFLRPQAEELGLDRLSEICIAQMPGMIAYQVHDLSKEVYGSIYTILNEHWTHSDDYYKNSMKSNPNAVVTALTNSLEVTNTQMMESLINVMDQFDIKARLSTQLMSCQTGLEENVQFAQRIWSALLVSTRQKEAHSASVAVILTNNIATTGFLSRYVMELVSDMESEMMTRLPELALSVYEDLSYS
ncbi:hypothetical protein K501DRAFT_245616 [Backusella circina FSU 941]|nr:hypothetical protein K501DRAFT_245616 [Backusella circina FSU 941]